MERESGFYWIKEHAYSEWAVAEWVQSSENNPGAFLLVGCEYSSAYAYEVDENRLTPPNKK